jgi:16S rRNA (adenine1518-N6/adenine1519-N6)-dimethyltransferase
MDLTDINELKTALQLAGLRANKNLGQHFLVDRDSLIAVMESGELTPKDTVVEIGPGLGVMTVPLTEKVSKVIAVELDEQLAEILNRHEVANLEVWQKDVRELDLSGLPKGYKVVANIPYYLTSPIFRLFLESKNRPKLMSLLIQKEVAQRICAEPGQMTVLALSVQYYGKPSYIQTVERHKFWPAPKVESAIIQVKVYDQPAFEADASKLFRLIKAGFGERRKMLKNSLAGGLNISIELAIKLIGGAKISPTARAQELSLSEWERLYAQVMKQELL